MKDVFNIPNLSRRSFLRRSLGITRSAIALTTLSFGNTILGGCMFAREIPDKETALSAILEELEKRYGEKFHQTHETQVVEKAYPEKGEKKYDFLLNPSTDESKIFTARVYVREDTARQSGNILDNYQQHIFDPIVCTPFREYLHTVEGIDGYSVQLSWNKMDSKVWKKEQVEEYMGKGAQGDPEIFIVIMIAEDSVEAMAQTVYEVQKGLWPLKRNMHVLAAISGLSFDCGTIYNTPVDKENLITRGNPPEYEEIKESIGNYQFRNKQMKPERWDGSGEVGDPNDSDVAITWLHKPQK